MEQTNTKRPCGQWPWLLGGIVAFGMAEPSWATEEEGDIQARAAVVVQAVAIEDVVEDVEEEDTFQSNFGPGFMLSLAEEELQEQIATFTEHLTANDWAKAFRLLTELRIDQLHVMVPMGDAGEHIAVKEQLQRQLLSLPPDGLRAFRLYFDGQANEQLNAIKNHPLPGSDAQLLLAQALVDRLLASSVGGEAAVLLGDLYFERGLFTKAQRSWQLALDQGDATGQAALTLQVKRALAMHRAGDEAQAWALFGELQARYSQTTVQIGNEAVDAFALLGELLGQVEPIDVAQARATPADDMLPKRDAMPTWHLRFLDQANRSTIINQSMGRNNYYSPPNDLLKIIPPVVADEQRVYLHWLGAVLAMDRQSGKLLWQTGSIKDISQSFSTRLQTNLGDPRNYRIALSKGVLLTTATTESNRESPFVLTGYDTSSGAVLWQSNARQDWSLPGLNPQDPNTGKPSLVGDVLVDEGWGYAIVHQVGQTDLFLRRFNPTTGEVDWTLALGGADPIAFQYTQVSRMPQPTLMMGSSQLYVMTNNGALIAVDAVSSNIKWALRMEAPFGLGERGRQNFVPGNQLGPQLSSLANTNGSDRLLLQGGILYAKEHNSKTLYALDAESGQLQWSTGSLKPDAKLVGVNEEHFYLMGRALECYSIKGNRDLDTKNGAQTGSPDDAGAIMGDEKILIYANGKLRLLDTTQLDPAGVYTNADYLGVKGGHLYHFDDLLIAIDTDQITAFKIQPRNKD